MTRVVLAQAVGLRHRDAAAGERGHHAVLAIDRVRRGQQLARGLAAQHVALSPAMSRKVGLDWPPLNCSTSSGPAEAVDVAAQVRLQRRHVEALLLGYRHGAAELLAHVQASASMGGSTSVGSRSCRMSCRRISTRFFTLVWGIT